MRISVRIVAGGNRSYTRIPLPKYTLDECLLPDGKLDVAKARMAFAVEDGAEYNPFMAADSDDESVFFASLSFMDSFRESMDTACDNPDIDVNHGSVTAQDDRLEHRMERGKYVIARVEIRRMAESVSVRLGVGNPLNLVGQSIQEAWEFCKTAAQILIVISRNAKWISVSCKERPEVIDSARDSVRRAELRREYASCPNRMRGSSWSNLCSPSKFDCPFYKNGECRYEEHE